LHAGLVFQDGAGVDVDDRGFEIGHGIHCAVRAVALHDYDGIREPT
jgi:hypothetical protein